MGVIALNPSGKGILNKTNKNYTYLGTCWKCEFGHLAKECKNIPLNSNLFDNTIQDQSMINSFRNSQSDSPTPQTTRQIKYLMTISPTKPPILTQQITADFNYPKNVRIN